MSAESPGETLRVLHWNIHSWIDPATGKSNADAVIALIREHEPDVVSLVEVDETWDEPSTLAKVAAETSYTPIFIPTFEYGTDAPVGGFGNGMLSRLPIQAVEQRQLTWPTTVYDGTEPSEPRSVLLVIVRAASGEDLCIGSTHLPRSSESARDSALNQLKAISSELPNPWVICGDFNTPATSWITEAAAVAPVGSATYPAELPTESIDYAVASPDMSLDAEVLAVGDSDHLPVLVRMSFQIKTSAS